MTKTEVPEIVLHSEMKRHWWIYYQWEVVTEVGDKETKYLRTLERPISQATEAADQFDESWRAYQGIRPD